MKILFLTFLYLEKTSGISKKIQAQVQALGKGGAEVHLCHFEAMADGRHWALAKTSDASEAERTWF